MHKQPTLTTQVHLMAGQKTEVGVAVPCRAAPAHCAVGVRAAARYRCITHPAWYLGDTRSHLFAMTCGHECSVGTYMSRYQRQPSCCQV